MTDLPFTLPDPDPTRPARPSARCHPHIWSEWTEVMPADSRVLEWVAECRRCGKPRDEAASRRGRTARRRGVSDELTVARLLGGSKVGPLGLPWDVVVDGYLRAQCKKLDRWPSVARVLEWLDAIPAGPELRAVTLADAPGHGRTRRLIVMDLDEFARWHGRSR